MNSKTRTSFNLRAPSHLLLLALLILPFSWRDASAKELFYLAGKININNADIVELKKLPFIGERRAKKIIAHRKKTGLFANPGEITSVDGISSDIFSSIKSYLSVRGKTNLKFQPYKGEIQPLLNINSFDGPVMALENEKYFYTLSEKIAGAKKSIIFSMYLFKTSKFKNNRANKVLAALLDAARRGVRVVGVFEKSDFGDDHISKANRKTADRLRMGGAKVFFDSKKKITHTKLFIVDERLLFIGSHNITHTALKKSNEASLMIDSPELAGYFKLYMENIVLQPL